MPHIPPDRAIARAKQACPGEEGYLLIGVIFLMALLVISLAVAIPKVKEDIQRDRDLETMHRGLQYRRAVQLYYRKLGSYPNTLDQLVKTNQIRFLRKKYVDPTTGKDTWKLIHVGQNKTQELGFFGEPLLGAGTGTMASLSSASGSSSLGSSTSIGGSSSLSGSSSGSLFSSPSSTNSTDSSNSQSGSGDSSGTGTGSSGSTLDAGNLSGQTFGGGGIIGVSPTSAKVSIMVYKKKNHYNEWEFFYDPASDRQNVSSSSVSGATNASDLNGSSSGSGFSINTNSGSGSSIFGSSSSSSSSTTSSSDSSSGSTTSTPTTTSNPNN